MHYIPARDGGLAIYDISESSEAEYSYSCRATSALTEAIYTQANEYHEDREAQYKIKTEITQGRIDFYRQKRNQVRDELNEQEKLQLDLASEKGASSWLTSLPLKTFEYLYP